MAVFQDKNKDKDVQGSQLGPSSAFTPAPSNQPQQLTPEQSQGSGRFTNLQQYLNANKGSGQKLASGIGSNIQKQIDPAKKDSQEYGSKVAQGIQSAQQNLQLGSEGLGQLKNIGTNIQNNTGGDNYGKDNDLGIESFTSNPNYNQFKGIQVGQGVNENQLNAYQQTLSNAANQYGNVTNSALNNLGSEGGRFQLLKDTYGGNANPGYNRGQQRLDQLFLKQDGIGGLTKQVGQEAQSADQLNKQASQSGQQVGNVINSEQQLIGDINSQAGSNEDNYVKMLESYIPKVNESRGAEYQSLEDAIKNKGQGLTGDQLSQLGVTGPTRAYNLFNTLNGASDIATKGADAQTYQDVANQKNVDQYSALANILGMKPEQQRLTEASKLGNAIQSRTDDGSLTNRLKGAEDYYNKHLGNQILSVSDANNPYNGNGTIR